MLLKQRRCEVSHEVCHPKSIQHGVIAMVDMSMVTVSYSAPLERLKVPVKLDVTGLLLNEAELCVSDLFLGIVAGDLHV